jgi:hypothetical protein
MALMKSKEGCMSDHNHIDKTQLYEIHLRGHIDPRWTHRFNGLQVEYLPDGTTRLTGDTLDQAALYVVLHQLADSGITLIKVSSHS